MAERKTYRIDMHQPGGRLVVLSDVLPMVKGPDLVWRMTFLWSSLLPGSTLDILELEGRTKDPEQVVLFSRSELRSLADQFDQTIDVCLEGRHEDGVDYVAVLEAHDSTLWEVTADESQVELDHERLAAFGAELVSD